MKSLRQQVLLWLLPFVVAASLLIGILVYWNAKSEVDELYNAHLQQIATLLAQQLNGVDLATLNLSKSISNLSKSTSNLSNSKFNLPQSVPGNANAHWEEEQYLIQLWDKHGQLYGSVS